MDQERFDELTRRAGDGVSRRQILKGVLLGAASTVFPWVAGGRAWGAECPPGQIICGGVCCRPRACCNDICVNLKKDKSNCGRCGIVCERGTYCSKGLCCPRGTRNCQGTCVNIRTDESNCGACGNVCPAEATCTDGACECPPGQEICGETCVSSLGQACNTGMCGVCAQGILQCVDGEVVCVGPEPSPEVCDGLDNDCDCVIDEDVC